MDTLKREKPYCFRLILIISLHVGVDEVDLVKLTLLELIKYKLSDFHSSVECGILGGVEELSLHVSFFL